MQTGALKIGCTTATRWSMPFKRCPGTPSGSCGSLRCIRRTTATGGKTREKSANPILTEVIFSAHQFRCVRSSLKALRELRIAPFANSGRMSDNFRPTQSLNNRSVRTNIQFAEQPIVKLCNTSLQLKALRELRIAPFANSGRMSDNFRPTQSLNNRSVRTNIQFAEQ
ncbi:hypothetical protein T265_13084, partial [Opisthorchis viverrini]